MGFKPRKKRQKCWDDKCQVKAHTDSCGLCTSHCYWRLFDMMPPVREGVILRGPPLGARTANE